MDVTQKSPVLVEPNTFVSPTLRKMVGAGLAASLAELVTIPIDTAKVRLQVRISHCSCMF